MNDAYKAQKNLKNDMIFLLIIGAIGIIFSFSIYTIIFEVIIYLGYIWASTGSKAAGILGIIIGITMIISNPISLILGIFLIMHSIKYLKNVN